MNFVFYLLAAPAFIFALIVVSLYDLYIKSKNEREREQAQLRREEDRKRRAEAARLIRQKKEDERKKNLTKFRETVFPLSCNDFEVEKIWSKWESVNRNFHDTDTALVEQGKAVFGVTVLLVDRDRALGVFQDGYCSSPYESTLSSCSCPYFEVYKTPCRHMYRLFLILSGNEKPDPRISNVSADLLNALYSIGVGERLHYISDLEHSSRYGCNSRTSKELEQETKLGLWVQDEPYFEPLLNRMTKDKILIALAKSGVKGFSRSWTKVRLVDWVINEHKDFLQFMFYDYVRITPPESALSWRDGIASYREVQPHRYIFEWTDALTE